MFLKKALCIRTISYLVYFILLVILVFLCSRFCDLISVQALDCDTFAYMHVHAKMAHGLRAHQIREFFGYGFYSYGLYYFTLNTLLVYSFIACKKIAWVIFLPRLVSVLPALGTGWISYKLSKKYLGDLESLAMSVLIFLMPCYTQTACWTHPDSLMLFWLSLGIWFLFQDHLNLQREYWIAVICFGISVATKIQSVTFLPMLFFYVVFAKKWSFKPKDIGGLIMKMGASFLAIGGVFVLLNPYLLHPRGLNAFMFSYHANMDSNVTNNSLGTVSVLDKIQHVLLGSYYSPLLLALVVLASFVAVYKINQPRHRIYGCLSLTIWINTVYLLFFVNKEWPHYYLGVMVLGVWLLTHLFSLFPKEMRVKLVVMVIIFQIVWACHIVYHSMHQKITIGIPPLPTFFLTQETRDKLYSAKKTSEFILANLDEVTPTTTVLLNKDGFDFIKLGLDRLHVVTPYSSGLMATIDYEAYKKANPQKSDDEAKAGFVRFNYLVVDKRTLDLEKNSEKNIIGKLGYRLIAQNDSTLIFKLQTRKACF